MVPSDKIDSKYPFQVNNREVALEKLPALSSKAWNVVKEYGFHHPQPSWELEDYDTSVREITRELTNGEALGTAACGVALIVMSIALVILAGAPAIPGSIVGMVGGASFIAIPVYEKSEWAKENRSAELKELKGNAEQYLTRFFQYYSQQGKPLRETLDREVSELFSRERQFPEELDQKIADLQKLRTLLHAQSEVKKLWDLYRQIAGVKEEPVYPKMFPTLTKGVSNDNES